FLQALERCGCQVAALVEFADHCAYAQRQLDELAHRLDLLEVTAVVCTCKDLVKVGTRWRGAKELWALEGRLKITEGEADLAGAPGGCHARRLRPRFSRRSAVFGGRASTAMGGGRISIARCRFLANNPRPLAAAFGRRASTTRGPRAPFAPPRDTEVSWVRTI